MSKFKQYMSDQVDEINRHKWIESEKANRDLGNSAITEWLIKFAKEFRKTWYESHS